MSIPAKILLVDDEKTILTVTRRLLEASGYEVFVAKDGTHGLELVRAHRPDLVLLDVNLPDIDGHEVCRQIKADPGLEDVFVLLFSAIHTDGDSQSVGLEGGADGYIARPIGNRELIARIQAMLRIQAAEAALRKKEAEIHSMYESMTEMFVLHELVSDPSGRPVDYRILDCNSAFERIMGIGRQQAIGALASQLYGTGEAPYLDRYAPIAETGTPLTFETKFTPLNIWFSISVFSPEKGRFATIASDITDRKQASVKTQELLGRAEQSRLVLLSILEDRKHGEEMLARQAEELRQRNEELARLYRASGSLVSGSSLDLQELAKTIVTIVQHEFGQANCSLLVVQKGSSDLARIAITGPYAEQVRDKKLSLDGPGIVAQAIRTGQVINTSDVRLIPGYVPNWESARSELTIPLKVGENVIGAIDVQSSQMDAFGADDERLMTIFAERATLAIEHTRLYSQTEQQLRRIASLHTVDMAIASSFDLNTTLSILLDQISKQLDVHASDILIFDRGMQSFKYASGHGFRTNFLRHFNFGMGDGYAWKVARERGIVTIQNIEPDTSEWKKVPDFFTEGFVSYVGVPLIAKGQLEGVLEIFHRDSIELDRDEYAFLEMLASQAAIAIDNIELFEHLQNSNADLIQAYDSTLEGWAAALELRDKETEGHTRRVADLTLQLARAMQVPDALMVQIYRGGLLHDIGKMGVPDSIVLKPGPLTDEEWVIMRKHPEYAYQMLSPITYLRPALDIPYCHHEKWDGTGYPRGLKEEQIPLAARVFAIVDVWDALTSNRPYRQAWPEAKAREYIREQAGRHFDPEVTRVFLDLSLAR